MMKVEGYPTLPPRAQSATPAMVKEILPLSRGSERGRSISETRTTREGDAIHGADIVLFAYLVQPLSHSGGHAESRSTCINFPAMSEIESSDELLDELTQQLRGRPPGVLALTLVMPTLGRIEVRAEQAEGGWRLDLGIARRDVLRSLRLRARANEVALAMALGHPVELVIHDLETI